MRSVITYDISNSNTRVRLAALLGSIGERVQRSVFLCDIDDKRLAVALSRVAQLIDEETDSVHVFPQCPTCRASVQVLGRAHVPPDVEYWIA
jgi:CRISPR-associated protein Cas2